MGTRDPHLADSYSTLLQVPNSPQPQNTNWGLPMFSHLLPLPPEAYFVSGGDDLWFVTVRATGEFVYIGPGPVTITSAPKPL